MTKMTEKQAAYIKSLVRQKLENLTDRSGPMEILDALLAVNLPEPTDTRDASAQIDALKGNIRRYRPERAQELLNRMGNEGFAALVQTVQNLGGIDHKLELASAQSTARIADTTPALIRELTDALRVS